MIKLSRIFQDGMVLQRQKPIRVWGESDRVQYISIKLDEKTVFAGECGAGGFSCVLPSQEAAQDIVLSVSGETDGQILRDIDIGEVWIAGGQSNMEFPLRFDAEADAVIPSAADGHLRFYDVGKYSFDDEEDEGFKDARSMDRWMKLNAENAGYFSAVGFYFAKSLRTALNVPIGIIGCNMGGTTAYAWLEKSCLCGDAELLSYINEYESAVKNIDAVKYERRGREARRLIASKRMQRMAENMMRGTPHFFDTVKALPSAIKVIRYTMMKGPADPNRPAGLYHTMVQKIAGYSCRGVIWYQGENDEGRAGVYGKLFAAVIRCWRDAWQDELPFLFVQLAPYEKSQMGSGDNFPLVREQQEWAGKHTAGAYMVSVMDAGMKRDIHPKRKRPVGERLALMARGKIYGEPVLCEPPEVSGVHLAHGVITLHFAFAGEGLAIRGENLNALKIIADKREIKNAAVQVEGDRVEIRSPEIKKGTSVELLFAREGYCEVNLYNSAGLSAKPFRY